LKNNYVDEIPTFETVVIGSSPLMLIAALEATRAGQSVTLLTSDSDLGGAWCTLELKNGQRLEKTCHLIECFPGVYEYLSAVSGCEFKILVPQPIRVDPSKRVYTYSTRTRVVVKLLRATLTFTVLKVRHVLGMLDGGAHNEMMKSGVIILDFMRFKRKLLFRGYSISAPVQGFAFFVMKLLQNVRECGVQFKVCRVRSAHRWQNRWLLELDDGTLVNCQRILASSSAILELDTKDTGGDYIPKSINFRHILVEVCSEKVISNIPYAVFPRDSNIIRISRISLMDATPTTMNHYLCQIKVDSNLDENQLLRILAEKFIDAKIVNDANDVLYSQKLDFWYPKNGGNLNTKEGEIRPNFFVYSSNGNLASGIACFLAGKKHLSFGKHSSLKLPLDTGFEMRKSTT
jgi:hypothetical protein